MPGSRRGSGVAARGGAVTNEKGTGKIAATGGLTPMQRKFVRLYVRNGGQSHAAAIESGYDPGRVRQAVYELMGLPKVRDAIRRESERYIQSNVSQKALGTMERLLDDESTPHNVQFQAAKWCLETAGIGGQNSQVSDIPDDKPLDEWSITELQAFIDGGQQALAQRRDQAGAEADAIDVTPDSAPDSAQSDDSGLLN